MWELSHCRGVSSPSAIFTCCLCHLFCYGELLSASVIYTLAPASPFSWGTAEGVSGRVGVLYTKDAKEWMGEGLLAWRSGSQERSDWLTLGSEAGYHLWPLYSVNTGINSMVRALDVNLAQCSRSIAKALILELELLKLIKLTLKIHSWQAKEKNKRQNKTKQSKTKGRGKGET